MYYHHSQLSFASTLFVLHIPIIDSLWSWLLESLSLSVVTYTSGLDGSQFVFVLAPCPSCRSHSSLALKTDSHPTHGLAPLPAGPSAGTLSARPMPFSSRPFPPAPPTELCGRPLPEAALWVALPARSGPSATSRLLSDWPEPSICVLHTDTLGRHLIWSDMCVSRRICNLSTPIYRYMQPICIYLQV